MRIKKLLLTFILLLPFSGVGCASSNESPRVAGECRNRNRVAFYGPPSPSPLESSEPLLEVLGLSQAEVLIGEGDPPILANRVAIGEAIEREAHWAMSRGGLNGTADVVFLVGERGKVDQVEIIKSSGHPRLDEAARRVARIGVFTMHRIDDVPVCVVISIPMSFSFGT